MDANCGDSTPLQELEQRYTRFRVEVQTALDRCESGATYASLAKRVITRENSEANASVPAASVRPALVKNPVVAMGKEIDIDQSCFAKHT